MRASFATKAQLSRSGGPWTAAYIGVTNGNMKLTRRKTRVYRQGARARGVAATREKILLCAYELWLEVPYEAVTIEAVAGRAGVSKQTVLRQFKSKDDLAVALVDWQRPREEKYRETEPGDVTTALSKLIDRYETMGDANVRVLEIERSVPAIQYLLSNGRASHRGWIEHVFAPFLPKRGSSARERRVMAFYAATDVYLWKLLRRDFGLDREETKAVFRELVEALVRGSGHLRAKEHRS
jgi:AcrR family transcriptional regulator